MAKKNRSLKDNPNYHPEKIVRSDGVETTIYRRNDEFALAEEASCSSLGEVKSVLEKKNDARREPPKKVDIERVFDVDDEEAEELMNAIDDDPSLLVSDDYIRGQTAKVFNDAYYREKALNHYRMQRKREVVSALTEDEIHDGTILLNEDGSVEAEVTIEPGEFNPERSGLTSEEKSVCMESYIDQKKANKRHAHAAQEAFKSNGEIDVEPELRSPYDVIFQDKAEQLYEQEMMEDERPSVDSYIGILDREEEYAARQERIVNAVAQAADIQEKDIKNKSLGEFNQLVQRNIDPEFVDSDTGVRMTFTTKLKKCTPAEFRTALDKNIESRLKKSDAWKNMSKEQRNKEVSSATSFYMMNLSRVSFSHLKAKKLFKDKYEAGKPLTRMLSIYDVEE